jgi:hypothetical protein
LLCCAGKALTIIQTGGYFRELVWESLKLCSMFICNGVLTSLRRLSTVPESPNLRRYAFTFPFSYHAETIEVNGPNPSHCGKLTSVRGRLISLTISDRSVHLHNILVAELMPDPHLVPQPLEGRYVSIFAPTQHVVSTYSLNFGLDMFVLAEHAENLDSNLKYPIGKYNA